MSKVKFWASFNGTILRVSGLLDDSLVDFFQGLQNDLHVAKDIPRNVPYRDCRFYRLKNPVLVTVDGGEGEGEDEWQDDVDDFPDEVKQACLEESNRVAVNPGRIRLRHLAETISRDHVCLVVEFPDPSGQLNEAIGRLRTEYDTLFDCLQVTVETLGNWRSDDVQRNLQGGIITRNDNRLPPEFRVVQEALEKQRIYQACAVDQKKPEFEIARAYNETQFDRIFTCQAGSRTVMDREFSAFHNVLQWYDRNVLKIIEDSSSSLKTSNFTVRFVQPPFFSESDNSCGFKYYQEKSWAFPVFVNANSAQNVWRKFTPKSDWTVMSPTHQVPFIVSKVISNNQESDRSRMLVGAIALARTGKFLLRSTSRRSFFVVAIYVDARMNASRYIVMQTGRGDTHHANIYYHNKAVCIHQKDFELTEAQQEVDFLREMYNLATEITELSRDLDLRKTESLQDIKDVAGKVLSLSSRYPETKTEEFAGGSEGLPDEDGLGVFEGDDIQNILHEMNYKIEFIPWGHPELAVIVNNTGDKHGYLKFVERKNEVKVLQYLMEIKSPLNHTISGVRFWDVQGGTVISMPVAGGWLTSLNNPGKQLWSVALQLVEAVAFMHEHNVAHMDLKPQNVIIPSKGGRLSLIDFSVSIRVRGPDVKYTGVVGTENYMAPEIHKGLYKPMLADLWSCGRTLKDLCSRCDSSTIRTTLLTVVRQLMDPDPEMRPRMATVLEWMTLTQGEEDSVVSPALAFFKSPTVSTPLSGTSNHKPT